MSEAIRTDVRRRMTSRTSTSRPPVPVDGPPHACLADGRSLFDTFGMDWTLLALGPEPPDVRPFVAAARARGMALTVVPLPAAEMRALYEAPLALIRPDQIVAWRGRSADGAAGIVARVVGG